MYGRAGQLQHAGRRCAAGGGSGRRGLGEYAWCTSPDSTHTVAGASGPSPASSIGSVSCPNDSGKAAQCSRSERCRRYAPTRAHRPEPIGRRPHRARPGTVRRSTVPRHGSGAAAATAARRRSEVVAGCGTGQGLLPRPLSLLGVEHRPVLFVEHPGRAAVDHGQPYSAENASLTSASRPGGRGFPPRSVGRLGSGSVPAGGAGAAGPGRGPAAGCQQPLSTDCRALFSAESTFRS